MCLGDLAILENTVFRFDVLVLKIKTHKGFFHSLFPTPHPN